MQKEHRPSFCINLEVVILEVEIQRSFFGRIHETIDCFRDLLTFSASSKLFMLALKPILLNANPLFVWHKMFVTATMCRYFLA